MQHKGTAVTGVDKIRKALQLQREVSVLPMARLDAAPEPGDRKLASGAGVASPAQPGQTRKVPIDAARLRAQRILAQEDTGPAAQAFKSLRTQTLQLLHRNGFNSIAIVSPTADDGRTVTAINLAASIADDPDHTALLVDFNLRRPSVHERFGIRIEHGVETSLLGSGGISDALVQPEGFRKLVLLPAARPVPRSAELLAADATRRMTRAINARYTNRVVLYDLPPLLETADALAFLRCVDAVLLVVREGRTRRDDVVRSLQLLRDTPVVGTVLNGSKDLRGL